MNNNELKEKTIELLTPELEKEGCALADMSLSHYKNSYTLKLFIYSEKGTSIDECSRISRLVGDMIDGTDYFEKGYTLEVSSPGLDRPLKTPADFKFRIGETVRIEFVDKKQKKETAEIIDIHDTKVVLKNDSGVFELELAEIEQAKIIF